MLKHFNRLVINKIKIREKILFSSLLEFFLLNPMCDLYNRRKIVNKSALLYPQVKKRKDPPLSLHGQLLWREFFYTVATNNPNFDRMKDNPLCVQIPWDKNPEALAKWAEVNIWGKYETNVHKSLNMDLKIC